MHQFAKDNYYKQYIEKIDKKFKTPKYDINEFDLSDEDEDTKEKYNGADRAIFKY